MATFLVPNLPDAVNIDIAEPDAGDFIALGYRATGITSGGAIAALGTPAMTVSVPATTGVINGVPFSFGATTKSITPAAAKPRFDLVGWDVTGAVVIPGQAGDNPQFPAYDPATFCFGAAVNVTPGASAITAQYVTAKGATQEPSLRRSYSTVDDVMVAGTVSAATYSVTAGGKHTWGSSILAKISDTVLEWTTSLKIKAADTALSVLTLTGRATDQANQAVLDIRSSGGAQIASINALGDLFANNFRFGTVAPEGVVTAARGCIYINTAASDGNQLYLKSTTSGNTGWVVHRAFDPTIGAIPTGSLVPWVGAVGATIPAGYVKAQGQGLNTTTYAALFAVCQFRFGGGGSTFNVPELRGRTVFGDGGAINWPTGSNNGIADGLVTLSVEHLPAHAHDVIDPSHGHPQAGPYWYYRASAFHNNRHPTPSTSTTLEHLYVDWDVVRASTTGVSIQNTGSNWAFSIMPPGHCVQWIIKT